MGLCLIPVDKMVRVIILGDSNLIIKGLRRLSKNALPSLIWIYPRIRDIENQFKSMSYFHILRRQNGKVDTLAKAHKQLAQGKNCVNKEYSQNYLALKVDHVIY